MTEAVLLKGCVGETPERKLPLHLQRAMAEYERKPEDVESADSLVAERKQPTRPETIALFIHRGGSSRPGCDPEEAVWQNVNKGSILTIRVGKNWIIPRDELLEFAKTYRRGPAPRRRKN